MGLGGSYGVLEIEPRHATNTHSLNKAASCSYTYVHTHVCIHTNTHMCVHLFYCADFAEILKSGKHLKKFTYSRSTRARWDRKSRSSAGWTKLIIEDVASGISIYAEEIEGVLHLQIVSSEDLCARGEMFFFFNTAL